MNNQISDGRTKPHVATAAITAGDLVHVGGGRCGIAVADIAIGATGTLMFEGEFEVPKVGTTAIAAGVALKIGTAGNTVAIASAGTTINNYLLARPTEASTTAQTTVKIKLG
jgi:predicted RecA/RadA family phage recombinase